MKRFFLSIVSGASILGLIAALIIINCSNKLIEPVTDGSLPGSAISLSKESIVQTYTNATGKFQFQYRLPMKWKKTLHGKQNIKGTSDCSDVLVYSPTGQYVPRFTIMSFSHDPGYPDDSAEFWSLWRENKIKEFYPDRFLGRVERGYATVAGQKAPMVVYDMLDETKQTSYRSTEYTLIVGGKLCTVQFTTLNSESGSLSKASSDNVLSDVYSSFKINKL